MPRTRRQSITITKRKRKKPDDEASLSSSGSFDDSDEGGTKVVAQPQASSRIRKKSPRRRPSRKRERLETVKVKEVVVETKVTRLTPKKRSLKEVEESSFSYQVEARKKAIKKDQTDSKRNKVSSSSEVANVSNERTESKATSIKGLTDNPLPAPPASSVNRNGHDEGDVYYLQNSNRNAENEDEQEVEGEVESLFVLPYAISASVDELDDHALPVPANTTLVTPQQPLPQNETPGSEKEPEESSNTISADLLANTDFPLPAHITTEKQEPNLDHEDDPGVASSVATADQHDNGEEVMLPRSLLHTLEQDNSAVNASRPSAANTGEEQEKQYQGSEETRSTKPSIASPHEEENGESLDHSQDSQVLLGRKAPIVTSQEQEELRVASLGVSPDRNGVKTPKNHQRSSFTMVAKPPKFSQTRTPPMEGSNVSTTKPRTTRVVSPSAMVETWGNQKIMGTADFRHTEKKTQSLLLVLSLILFKMIAVAEVTAIVALVLPRWFLSEEMHFDDAVIPRNKPRKDNLFSPWWKKQVRQEDHSGASRSKELHSGGDGNNQWVASLNEIRQDVSFVFDLCLEDGKEIIATSIHTIQDYCSLTIPMMVEDGRDMIVTVAKKIRKEYSDTALVLLEDSREILWMSGNKMQAYARNALIVLGNGGTMLIDSFYQLQEYVFIILTNGRNKLFESTIELQHFVENTNGRNILFESTIELQHFVENILKEKVQISPRSATQVEHRVPKANIAQDGCPDEVKSVESIVDSSIEQIKVPSFQTIEEFRDHELDERLQEVKTTVEAEAKANELDPTGSLSNEIPGFDSESTEEWKAKLELESEDPTGSINPFTQDEIEGAEASYSDSASLGESYSEGSERQAGAIREPPEEGHCGSTLKEHQREESMSPAEAIGQMIEEASGPREASERQAKTVENQAKAIHQTTDEEDETEREFEQNDQAKVQEAKDIGLTNQQVRFSDAVEEFGKADIDEVSLTDTTVGSEDQSLLDDMSEEEAPMKADGEGTAPQPNVEPAPSGKASSSCPPALLSLAAMLNSTVSKQNAPISKRLASAKSFLVKKKDSVGKKQDLGSSKRISLFLSKIKAAIDEKKSGISKRLENSKLFSRKKNKTTRRLPERLSLFLTKLKSSFGSQIKVITIRFKKLLSKQTQRLSTRTPVQLREPVGAPILQKQMASKKSTTILEKAVTLNDRRKDSMHPGKSAGIELLKKARRMIEHSRRAIPQWLKLRFLAIKAFLMKR